MDKTKKTHKYFKIKRGVLCEYIYIYILDIIPIIVYVDECNDFDFNFNELM